jgi:HlyD family secretion protein
MGRGTDVNKQRRKLLLKLGIGAVILVIGGFLFFETFSSSNPESNFRTVKVDRGEISFSVTATGTINPVITVLVGSQVSGTIKALYADYNSRVKENQVIAQIDPAIFEAQVEQGKASVQNAQAGLQSAESAVRTAQANVQNAEAALQNAQAGVQNTEAAYRNAESGLANAQANVETSKANLTKSEVAVTDGKRTLERNRELIRRQVIAQSAFDTAEAGYDTAVAQVSASRAQVTQAVAQVGSSRAQVEQAGAQRESSKAQVDQARAQVAQAKAQVETARAAVGSARAQIEQARASLKISETNLRYATIRSPVNGTVISRNVDVGQTVAASLQAPTLFTIAKDLTQMQVDTNVSEADVGRVAVGQEATFTVDAYPDRTFRGKVSEIRNAPITVQNVVTYDVVIEVRNQDLRLKPGMTANVSILIARRENILKVSNAALRFRPAGAGNGKEEGGAAVRQEGASKPGSQVLERLTRELGLTGDQQAKVGEVLKGSRAEFQEAREKAANPDVGRVRVQALLKQKIWGLLTEEQRGKFSQMEPSSSKVESRTPGKVWVLSAEGKPVGVSVVIGITNGTASEVVEGELKEGAEVIVEDLSKKKATGPSGSSAPPMRGLGR